MIILENYGVQELSPKEIRITDGGWIISALRIAAKILAAVAAIDGECGGCVGNTVRDVIANGPSGLGDSRPFE